MTNNTKHKTRQNASHTPGQWRSVKTSFNNWLIKTAKVVICYRIDEEADARLIAAAPELLEALDYLLEQTVDQDLKYGIGLSEGEMDARAKALAVIAKATERAA